MYNIFGVLSMALIVTASEFQNLELYLEPTEEFSLPYVPIHEVQIPKYAESWIPQISWNFNKPLILQDPLLRRILFPSTRRDDASKNEGILASDNSWLRNMLYPNFILSNPLLTSLLQIKIIPQSANSVTSTNSIAPSEEISTVQPVWEEELMPVSGSVEEREISDLIKQQPSHSESKTVLNVKPAEQSILTEKSGSQPVLVEERERTDLIKHQPPHSESKTVLDVKPSEQSTLIEKSESQIVLVEKPETKNTFEKSLLIEKKLQKKVDAIGKLEQKSNKNFISSTENSTIVQKNANVNVGKSIIKDDVKPVTEPEHLSVLQSSN